MREIKLRYFHKGEWVYINFNTDNLAEKFTEWEERRTSKFMQFTGIKDKNGVDIYEGDLVSLLYRKGLFEIRFIDSAYRCYSYRSKKYFFPIIIDEVIGNIYENKELLND